MPRKIKDRMALRKLRDENVHLIAAEAARSEPDAFRKRLEEIALRRPMKDGPFGTTPTDEIMRLLRGED